MSEHRLLQGISVVVCLTLAACGSSKLPEIAEGTFDTDLLVSALVDDVGLDTAQAAAGLGVMLEYASTRLPRSDYAALSRLLPKSDEYLRIARDAKLLAEPIGDTDTLHDALGDIGIGGGETEDMVAAVGDYLGQVSGPATQGAFSRLF